MSEFAYADLTPQNPQIKCERPACRKLLPPGVELYILHDNKDSSNGFGASRLKIPTLFIKYIEMSPEQIMAVFMAMFNHWAHTHDIPLANRPGHHLCPRDWRNYGPTPCSVSALESLRSIWPGYHNASSLPTPRHLTIASCSTFWGVTRKPGRVKPEVIGDMWHVHDKIKVSIRAGEIKELAWNSLWPKWDVHTGGYNLDITQCTIYNKDWVEIVPNRTPDVKAIADCFYKPNTKAPNQPIFKTGKYLVYLCIPWDIYSAWLDYDTEKQAAQYDNTEDDVGNDDHKSEGEESVALVARMSISARGASRPTSRQTSRQVASGSGHQLRSRSSKQHPRSITSQSSGFPQSSATTQDRSAALNPASFSSRSPGEKENEFNGDQLDSEVTDENPGFDIGSTPGSATRSSIPILSREAPVKTLSQQTTPSRKEIGGLISVLASIAREHTLSDLLDNSGKLESFLRTPAINVILHLDLTPKAQKRGGFKMAAFGRSSTRIFGPHTGTGICAKRTYYEQKDVESGIVHYLPHPSPRQAQDLAVKVMCNVWTASLLNDVYAEVDRFISLSKSGPPAKIPRMRFVKVAFATEGKQVTAGAFQKYINNNAPTPNSFLFDCENQNCAQFLAFSQHWQFRRTHGLAFVSDYQGGDTLLTDPQIMSDASLGDIFALGNMPSGCKDFPKIHRCNKFCEYFQITNNFNNFDCSVDMSISVADRPLVSSSNGKHKAQDDPDKSRAARRTKMN
ncbi:hypothetical protein MVEN_01434100 [Mycena venus]|uniref:Alpha-type protein kinase domain-containing protein n=1 Tax=Mycena venus TaxID=2733690 RepID=A0A8H7CSV4_9AGAR|nr:hypothetical protein MVEN_01434100 [Mycena venus]